MHKNYLLKQGNYFIKNMQNIKKSQKKTGDKLKNEDEGGNKNKQKKGCC